MPVCREILPKVATCPKFSFLYHNVFIETFLHLYAVSRIQK